MSSLCEVKKTQKLWTNLDRSSCSGFVFVFLSLLKSAISLDGKISKLRSHLFVGVWQHTYKQLSLWVCLFFMCSAFIFLMVCGCRNKNVWIWTIYEITRFVWWWLFRTTQTAYIETAPLSYSAVWNPHCGFTCGHKYSMQSNFFLMDTQTDGFISCNHFMCVFQDRKKTQQHKTAHSTLFTSNMRWYKLCELIEKLFICHFSIV